MIEILQETTDWGNQPVANGIYHVNGAGQLVQHNDKVFKHPIKQFSKARRTFKKIGELDVFKGANKSRNISGLF